jgi:hypothetical protein
MRTPILLLLVLAACAVPACGGQTASQPSSDASVSTGDDAGEDSAHADGWGTDASPTGDAASDAAAIDDAGTQDANSLPDACTAADAASLVGRVPMQHRPAGGVCPARPPGGGATPGCFYDSGAGCAIDRDCTAGVNGRCLDKPIRSKAARSPTIPPPCGPPMCCGPPQCSYDECVTDSDCPAGSPCLCRSNGSDVSPNVCAGAGNCKLDSDCGPGGYCSPDNCWPYDDHFFCHGPADTCIDDTDCCWPTPACRFDSAAGHFECKPGCPAPP